MNCDGGRGWLAFWDVGSMEEERGIVEIQKVKGECCLTASLTSSLCSSLISFIGL